MCSPQSYSNVDITNQEPILRTLEDLFVLKTDVCMQNDHRIFGRLFSTQRFCGQYTKKTNKNYKMQK